MNGPVEYYFAETSGTLGGSDSGWQTSRTYTDTDLAKGTSYSYTVQMRDAVCNLGTLSDSFVACTRPDIDIVDDNVIDILDLAAMFAQWLETNCCLTALCNGTDLDASGTVDMGDFGMISQNWLASLEPDQDPYNGTP